MAGMTETSLQNEWTGEDNGRAVGARPHACWVVYSCGRQTLDMRSLCRLTGGCRLDVWWTIDISSVLNSDLRAHSHSDSKSRVYGSTATVDIHNDQCANFSTARRYSKRRMSYTGYGENIKNALNSETVRNTVTAKVKKKNW